MRNTQFFELFLKPAKVICSFANKSLRELWAIVRLEVVKIV